MLVHLDPTLVDLTIDGETLETTPEHPFYIEQYGWLDAGLLWQGAQVRKADGSYGTVQAVKVVQRQQVMYNLTVDTAHTFFVGDEHWLVHNTCPQNLIDDAKAAQARLGDTRGKISPYTNWEYAEATTSDGSILIHNGLDRETQGLPALSDTKRLYDGGHQAFLDLNSSKIQFNFKRFESRSNSHAELKAFALRQDVSSFGVSRPMCMSCQLFFDKAANKLGRTLVIADPEDIWISEPGRKIYSIPNVP